MAWGHATDIVFLSPFFLLKNVVLVGSCAVEVTTSSLVSCQRLITRLPFWWKVMSPLDGSLHFTTRIRSFGNSVSIGHIAKSYCWGYKLQGHFSSCFAFKGGLTSITSTHKAKWSAALWNSDMDPVQNSCEVSCNQGIIVLVRLQRYTYVAAFAFQCVYHTLYKLFVIFFFFRKTHLN